MGRLRDTIIPNYYGISGGSIDRVKQTCNDVMDRHDISEHTLIKCIELIGEIYDESGWTLNELQNLLGYIKYNNYTRKIKMSGEVTNLEKNKKIIDEYTQKLQKEMKVPSKMLNGTWGDEVKTGDKVSIDVDNKQLRGTVTDDTTITLDKGDTWDVTDSCNRQWKFVEEKNNIYVVQPEEENNLNVVQKNIADRTSKFFKGLDLGKLKGSCGNSCDGCECDKCKIKLINKRSGKNKELCFELKDINSMAIFTMRGIDRTDCYNFYKRYKENEYYMLPEDFDKVNLDEKNEELILKIYKELKNDNSLI